MKEVRGRTRNWMYFRLGREDKGGPRWDASLRELHMTCLTERCTRVRGAEHSQTKLSFA